MLHFSVYIFVLASDWCLFSMTREHVFFRFCRQHYNLTYVFKIITHLILAFSKRPWILEGCLGKDDC